MRTGTSSSEYIRYGLEEGAKKAKEHGFSCLDFSDFTNIETDFFRLPEEEFKQELLKIKAAYEAAGITVFQAHAPWRCPAKDSTPEDRAEWFEAMSKAIRGCSYLGCPNFVIHVIMPFGTDSPDNPEEMISLNTEFMSGLGKVAAEYGVKHINIENLPFKNLPINYTHQVVEFVKDLNKINGTDMYKVCFDTGHSNFCAENIADSIRLIGKELLGTLHIHDNNGKADQHLIPGLGTIDWKEFLQVLGEIGFDGVLNLEIHECQTEEEQIKAANIISEWAEQIKRI